MPQATEKQLWPQCWLWLVWCCVVCIGRAQSPGPALREASAIAYDAAGNLYIADASSHRVIEATLGGVLLPIAGTGVQGFAGDGGAASSAELNQPQGIAIGQDGTVYIADTGNHRVRAVSPGGTIVTIAGTGTAGYGGDGGHATAARLRGPTGLAFESTGGLLVCDTGNYRVRRVSGGLITTLAGVGLEGFAGDGGAAASAKLDGPSGVASAADGRVFVADTRNNRVRVIDLNGAIETVAGNGLNGFAGDGGPALGASLSGPRGVALDAAGNLLIADAGNQRVRVVNASGVISSQAGNGVEGASADAAGRLSAPARAPRAVAVTSFGLPVFADTMNGTVRVIDGAALFQPAALVSGRVSNAAVQIATTQTYGSASATANVQGSVGTAQGTLQVTEGDAVVATADLSSGSAQINLSALSAGTHTLSLSYLGDGLNPAANASSPAVKIDPRIVTATASSASAAYGVPLPLLSGQLTGVLPADVGQVNATFQAGAGVQPAVGVYPVQAVLTGPKAADYAVTMSSTSGQLTVVKADTSATLGMAGQPFVGIPFALQATVVPGTRGQPTGTVQFLDGNVVVGTGRLVAGVAGAVYSSPPSGARALSVQYLGDGNFLPSASAPALVSVSPLPDFNLLPAGSQAASTSAGGTATYTITAGAAPGPFTGAITFSCTGLPPGASATFSPPAVIPGTGSATVTISVQTPAPSATSAYRLQRGGRASMAAGLLGFTLFRLRRVRRDLRYAGVLRCLLLLLAACETLAGCGARTIGEGTGGVLAQSYTLNITGTGTNLAGAVVTHSISLTLTVQQ